MLLFIDACLREESRTRKLALQYLNGSKEEIRHLELYRENIGGLDKTSFADRNAYLSQENYTSTAFGFAHEFALADEIVIAAPYWDLSFPAKLKEYIEQINVVGITFRYNSKGIPEGLCRAKTLTYITTAGGPIVSDEYGYGYIKTLSTLFYGIKEVHYIKAEGLDQEGANVEAILRRALNTAFLS